MEKRGALIVLSLFLIQAVSAQFFGGYGGFSLGEFFDRIDPQTAILGALFLVFFVLIFYPLSRFFKDQYGQPNKAAAGIPAGAISFIIIYEIYRSGFNIEDLFYGLGVPSDFIYNILPIIILAFAILIIWVLGRRRDELGRKTFSLKRGLGGFFMLSGLLLILLSIFTEIFYEKTTVLVIGIIFLLLGIILSFGRATRPAYDWQKEKRQWKGRTHVFILGILLVILGLIISQIILIIAGIILTIIGAWLWYRKRPGLYRPLTPSYNWRREKKQFKSGTPVLFLGILVVIFGLIVNQTTIVIVGAIIAVIGLLLRIFKGIR